MLSFHESLWANSGIVPHLGHTYFLLQFVDLYSVGTDIIVKYIMNNDKSMFSSDYIAPMITE